MALALSAGDFVGWYTLWLVLVALVWRYVVWRIASVLYSITKLIVHNAPFDPPFQVYRAFVYLAWIPLVGYAAYRVLSRAGVDRLTLGLAIQSAIPVFIGWFLVMLMWRATMSQDRSSGHSRIGGLLFRAFMSESHRRGFRSVAVPEALAIAAVFVAYLLLPSLLGTAMRTFHYAELEAPFSRWKDQMFLTEPAPEDVPRPNEDW